MLSALRNMRRGKRRIIGDSEQHDRDSKENGNDGERDLEYSTSPVTVMNGYHKSMGREWS